MPKTEAPTKTEAQTKPVYENDAIAVHYEPSDKGRAATRPYLLVAKPDGTRLLRRATLELATKKADELSSRGHS